VLLFSEGSINLLLWRITCSSILFKTGHRIFSGSSWLSTNSPTTDTAAPQRGVALGYLLALGGRREMLPSEQHARTADALTLGIRKMLNIILYHHNHTLFSSRVALSNVAPLQHVDGCGCIDKNRQCRNAVCQGCRMLRQLAEISTPKGGAMYANWRRRVRHMP